MRTSIRTGLFCPDLGERRDPYAAQDEGGPLSAIDWLSTIRGIARYLRSPDRRCCQVAIDEPPGDRIKAALCQPRVTTSAA